MRILLTAQAVSDIEEASAYYGGMDEELSARFVDDVDATIARIVMFPRGSPPVDGFDNLRRARMRQFPYGLFDEEIQSGDVLVVRVLHSRRHRHDALED